MITLVLVSDNHFAVMTAVLLKSIDLNYTSNNELEIFIVSDGLSKSNISHIEKSVENELIKITWIPIRDIGTNIGALPLDNSSFPLSVYARLYIPYFLPISVKRAIYLDVDTIVLTDIANLWNTNISPFAVAAVTDLAQTVSVPWAGIQNYNELGIKPDSKYFNTGVLIFDVAKWRKENITNQIIDCILENISYARFPDQYGMNVYFANNWYELGKQWNCFASTETENPSVIHFTGVKPIYSTYENNDKYRSIFFEYLRQTPFKNFKVKSGYTRLFKKASDLVKKKLRAVIRVVLS